MTYHVFVQFDVPSNKRDAFVEAALFNAASVILCCRMVDKASQNLGNIHPDFW